MKGPSLEELLRKHGIEPAEGSGIRKAGSSDPNRKCCEPGCDKLGQHLGRVRKDGTIIRRARCAKHHAEHQARKKGQSVTEWKNSFHQYLKYRKPYCENRDGRLGFKCDYTIQIPAQLQVDHIDGNPYNNDPGNLQTLCANCHIVKTIQNGDTLTPGRKKIKDEKRIPTPAQCQS